MVFNRFSLFLLLRLGILLVILTTLAYIFAREELFFTQLLLIFLSVLSIYELLRFVNRTNHNLSRFVLSVLDQDYTATYAGNELSKSFDQLNASFMKIMQEIKQAKLEKQAQLHYLKSIIDHIDFGIVSLGKSEQIELINAKAAEILSIPQVRSWQLLKNENVTFFEAIGSLDEVSKKLLEININGSQKQLSVTISELTLLGKSYRIITFKDIKTEIAQKEIEAWHKLIRILTHEIMNSVTPIASMTETMQMLLQENHRVKTTSQITNEELEDLDFSIKTMNSRAEGLLHFVEDYRQLTRIPTPKPEMIDAELLLKQVLTMHQAQIHQKKIKTTLDLQTDHLYADKTLIEQVLINLVKNACEAMTARNSINQLDLTCKENRGFTKIIISDTGSGIEKDHLEKIFIPFFSTKNDGSGIGLSLSRQILNLHGGYIEVQSKSGQGSTFELVLPLL